MNINFKMVAWGTGLLAGGILAPSLLGVRELGILKLMEESIAANSSDHLLFAATWLVFLNSIRALPHYAGALLIAEGLGFFRLSRAKDYLILVPLLCIPLVYKLIWLIYGIAYDFGIPAVSMIVSIFIVHRQKNMVKYTLHKVIILMLLLFGIQWLDIVPMLTYFGFGHGEVSMDIKLIASFIQAQDTLDFIGITMFIVFFSNALLTARLLSVYTREIKEVEEAWRLEKLSAELQMQALENRSLREITALVHDLKTPLASIQGLAGVLYLSELKGAGREYVGRISDAVDKMNIMINELLSDDKRQVITVRELVEYSVAHMPALNNLAGFNLVLQNGDRLVNVNKIKMSRALINILENSLEAVDADAGRISVFVDCENGEIIFRIEDNGRGIATQYHEHIWAAGFSTKNSSGVGLPFVRDVIEKHGGTIDIDSQAGKGTRAVIMLPEAQE